MKLLKNINESNKVLYKNFTSLSLLQISNYIFPFITLPYLVRVLGPEKYGLVNFAVAFTTYFTIITDYGFNLSAVQEISINRNNKERVSEIFSSVLLTKIILFGFSTILFFLIINSFAIFKDHYVLYLVTYFSVLGSVLNPVWFYQGMEKMGYIFIINFSVRTVITICIFLFIEAESDFVQYAWFNSTANFLIGTIGLAVIIFKLKITFRVPKIDLVKEQFKNGWNLFLSTVSINFYTTSNIFLLGLLTNATAVGYYSAADKIRIAAQSILQPFSQTVFPRLNVLINQSEKRYFQFLKKIAVYQTIIMFFVSLILFLGSKKIILVFLGPKFIDSVIVLEILSGLPLLSSFTTIFTMYILIVFKKHFYYLISFFISGIVSLIVIFSIVPKIGFEGAAIAMVIAELIALLSAYFFSKRLKNFYKKLWT